MIVIKIGGSVLTQKGIWREIDYSNMCNIANQIKECREKIVLLHGLGSFGRAYEHYFKHRNIGLEHITMAQNIQLNMLEFHNFFVKSLVEAGIRVKSIDPNTVFACDNNKIVHFFREEIEYYLEQDIIPVIHGGIIFDKENGYYLLSSDNMAEEIAKTLMPQKVIWVTDVDGVLKKRNDGNLVTMEAVNKDNIQIMWNPQYNDTDITGGMANKVEAAIRLSDCGIKSLIINGNRENELVKSFMDEKVKGTIIG